MSSRFGIFTIRKTVAAVAESAAPANDRRTVYRKPAELTRRHVGSGPSRTPQTCVKGEKIVIPKAATSMSYAEWRFRTIPTEATAL